MGYVMLKLSVSLFVFLSVFSFRSVSAQDRFSIQLNGGLISPRSSSTGFTGALQFNLPLAGRTQIYFYTGYSSWDKLHQVINPEGSSEVYPKTMYQTYSEDDHTLIPIFAGLKFYAHSTDYFNTFINFELGYSYSAFNKYSKWNTITREGGGIMEFYPDNNSKTRISYNLYGFGFGGGIESMSIYNFKVLLFVKLNTHLNSEIQGLFSRRGTYSTFGAGINYLL